MTRGKHISLSMHIPVSVQDDRARAVDENEFHKVSVWLARVTGRICTVLRRLMDAAVR